jgi:alkylation response protein AidB-like acyl-CoA dehydrogenase
MNFAWEEEQLAYKQAVIEFAQSTLNENILAQDVAGIFPRDKWQKCAEFGIQGLPIPEAYGGSGADILTTVLVMEGLGYGCRDNGLAFALNAQMWAVQLPILTMGSEKQKQTYLPGLANGALIGAHAISEPDSGSDAYSLRTRATKVEGGYQLNGTKMFITNASVADVVLVFATVNPDYGRWGVTAFLVDKETPGFSVGRELHKMGLRTSPMSEVILADCFVPEENRLGPEGAGVAIHSSCMVWERSGILASQIGAMERQLEDSVRYAKERQQFGQSIGKFQAISNRIADMQVRLETSRLLLYKVAWLKKIDADATLAAAQAKLHISESFLQNSLDAMRIHGGYGYMSEFGVERDLRDAFGGVIYSGTSDIQRLIIAKELEL